VICRNLRNGSHHTASLAHSTAHAASPAPPLTLALPLTLPPARAAPLRRGLTRGGSGRRSGRRILRSSGKRECETENNCGQETEFHGNSTGLEDRPMQIDVCKPPIDDRIRRLGSKARCEFTAKSGMMYPEAMQQSRRDQQGAATLNESHWAQFP
jgi:hypothetical protein